MGGVDALDAANMADDSARYQDVDYCGPQDNASSPRLNLVRTLLGNCMCAPFPTGETRALGPNTQVVELHGVKYIGLGALIDELTPRQRVFDTLEQLTTRTDRLISVGYLLNKTSGVPVPEKWGNVNSAIEAKMTETVPLDIWSRNFPNENFSREVQKIVQLVRNRQYSDVIDDLSKALANQVSRLNAGNNKFIAGITAHNIGVLKVLSGRDGEAEPFFRKAIALKEAAFREHDRHETAVSWSELGTHLFSRSDFEAAQAAFKTAHDLETKHSGGSSSHRPHISMLLNNIACCHFQLGDHAKALSVLEEARSIQQSAPSAQDDLDLLHVATVICNCGYLKLAMKDYEEARSLFEEGLLIQQSVLGEDHRAIRDTRSNIEFTNAFHSVD